MCSAEGSPRSDSWGTRRPRLPHTRPPERSPDVRVSRAEVGLSNPWRGLARPAMLLPDERLPVTAKQPGRHGRTLGRGRLDSGVVARGRVSRGIGRHGAVSPVTARHCASSTSPRMSMAVSAATMPIGCRTCPSAARASAVSRKRMARAFLGGLRNRSDSVVDSSRFPRVPHERVTRRVTRCLGLPRSGPERDSGGLAACGSWRARKGAALLVVVGSPEGRARGDPPRLSRRCSRRSVSECDDGALRGTLGGLEHEGGVRPSAVSPECEEPVGERPASFAKLVRRERRGVQCRQRANTGEAAS
jgi:hypothetical protein